MYRIITPAKWLTACLLTLAAGSCSDDAALSADDRDSRPCTVAIAVKSNVRTATRTDVVVPGTDLNGRQHVTRVQLYIFEETAGANDFVCVATEDIGWHHLEGTLTTGLPTCEQFYAPSFRDFKPNGRYLFLAVGFDDTYKLDNGRVTFDGKNSVEAFAPQLQPQQLVQVGDLLSAGRFALQKGKAAALLNRCEPFAGRQIYTTEELRSNRARQKPIVLHRRVAGLKGNFKGMPSAIDGQTIGSVRLELYAGQNTQGYLQPQLPQGFQGEPKDVPDKDYADFITSPDADPVLASRQVDAAMAAGGAFSLAAYALPAAASDQKGISTLSLTFCDAENREIARRRILLRPVQKPVRSGTGIIDPGRPDGDSHRLHYPIRANSFYLIGQERKPIDLSGTSADIYVDIDTVWDEYYGGALDEAPVPGVGMDLSWGEHEGGALDAPQP